MSKTAVREAPKTRSPKAATPVQPEVVTPAVEEDIAPVCVHRWVIEMPNGETSHGKCRNCGAEKEFPNSAEDGLWEREVPQSRWTGRTDWTPSSGA